jgi:hypothetical protein
LSLQTPSANGVHIAGSFADNGNPYPSWNPGVIEMLPTADPNIFEVTLNLTQGNYQYKFINGNVWLSDESIPSDCSVNNNRGVTVGATPIIEEYCFTQCTQSCIQNPNPANITFKVDMSTLISNGGFDLITDTLWMISGGTSPAWQAGRTVMTDADGDMVYECVANISGPAEFQYKYLGGTAIVQDSINFEEGFGIDSTGCGVANGVEGWNRTFIRSGNDEATGVYCFDQCTDCDGNPQILSRGTTTPSNPVCAQNVGSVYILVGGNQSVAGSSLWSVPGSQCNQSPTTTTTTAAPTTTTTTAAPTTTTTTAAPTTTTTTAAPTTTTTSTTTTTTTAAPTTTTTTSTTTTTTTTPVYSYCTGYDATDCCRAQSDYITNCGGSPL